MFQLKCDTKIHTYIDNLYDFHYFVWNVYIDYYWFAEYLGNYWQHTSAIDKCGFFLFLFKLILFRSLFEPLTHLHWVSMRTKQAHTQFEYCVFLLLLILFLLSNARDPKSDAYNKSALHTSVDGKQKIRPIKE